MKLDQKCIDALVGEGFGIYEDSKVVRQAYPRGLPARGIYVELVPESECEFWAHKELNMAEERIRAFVLGKPDPYAKPTGFET